MGVKVGPQHFQRLLAWVVRNCPFSGPYIDDVLTGTGSSVRYVDSDRFKGKRFDSPAYADRPVEEFLHPCFKPPPVLPDGSVNTFFDTPLPYGLPQSPTVREQIYLHYLCLRALFHAFGSADLTVKPARCFLLRQQVQCVGHVLAGGKPLLDPDKTKALREWQTTHITTAKALKSFLALANWYSMYIGNYAQHAEPLMEALKGKYMYEHVEVPGQTTDPGGLPKKSRKRVKLTPKQAAIDWTGAVPRTCEPSHPCGSR